MEENNPTIKEVIPQSRLDNKQDKEISKLFEISFEYLLAGVSESYMKCNRIQTIDDFNKRNEIKRPLLLTYPFFVSLANGHSRSLFNLFGNFLSYSYGPASESVKKLIPLDKKNFGNSHKDLNYITINPYNIQIRYPNSNKASDLKNDIKQIAVSNFSSSSLLRFNEIGINSDDGKKTTLLCDAIDKGILLINKISHGEFFDGSTTKVLDFAMNFGAWRTNYNDNIVNVLSFESLQKDRQNAYGSSVLEPA